MCVLLFKQSVIECSCNVSMALLLIKFKKCSSSWFVSPQTWCWLKPPALIRIPAQFRLLQKARLMNEVCRLSEPPGVRKRLTTWSQSPVGSFREFEAQVAEQQCVAAETDPKSVAWPKPSRDETPNCRSMWGLYSRWRDFCLIHKRVKKS